MQSIGRIPRCVRKANYSMAEASRCIVIGCSTKPLPPVPKPIIVTKPYEEIPGPPRSRWPFVGNLNLIYKNGPHTYERMMEMFEEFHYKYGDIVKVDLGFKMVLLFNPVDIETMYRHAGAGLPGHAPGRPVLGALKHYRKKRRHIYSSAGLITTNGKEWKRLRDAVNFIMRPEFSSNYYLPGQDKIAEDFVAFLLKRRNLRGQIPDLMQQIYRYTEEAIGQVCFGKRLGLLDPKGSGDVTSFKLTQAIEDSMQALADSLIEFPWWKLFKTQTYKKLESSLDIIQGYSLKYLEEALKKVTDPKYDDVKELEFLRRLLKNKDLTIKDINLLITEMFSFGIDATGNTIGFILYHLSQRPDVQEKLYQEIQNHKSHGLHILSPKKPEMRFLDACLKESYRLQPTSAGTSRILAEPAVFSGYRVPAGVTCFGMNPLVCREENYYERAKEYVPERWYVDEKAHLKRLAHPFAILPFSAGIRGCVGRRFAEQEIKLVVTKIVDTFKLDYDGPPIGSKMRLTLIPDKPLDITFIERLR